LRSALRRELQRRRGPEGKPARAVGPSAVPPRVFRRVPADGEWLWRFDWGENSRYSHSMRRVSAARQLALWIGRKGRGRAQLAWGDATLALYVDGLQILAVEGDDGERLASAFGLVADREWFRQAQAAVDAGQVSQGEAAAVVKRALAARLKEFFLADDGKVTFDNELPPEPAQFTISYPHLIIEMMLGSDAAELAEVFLPDPELVLFRLPDFARRVAALGLTDEALAVFAKINDVRSAREIVDPSPHNRVLVLRLLATAVGAGLVDASPRLADVVLPPAEPLERKEPARRRGALAWVLALVAVGVIAAVLAVLRPWEEHGVVVAQGPWSIAVDGGCQPAEVERLYRRQDANRGSFRVVPFGDGGERCYRLVWGRFPDREAAERALAALPDGVLTRGFSPHVVRADEGSP